MIFSTMETVSDHRANSLRKQGDTADTYYRAVDWSVGYYDGFDDTLHTYRCLKIEEYPVARYTPKGASIRTGNSGAHDTRFVSRFTSKQFAHPTKEAALADYIRRKQMQASIFRMRADTAEAYKSMAEAQLRLLSPPPPEPIACSPSLPLTSASTASILSGAAAS